MSPYRPERHGPVRVVGPGFHEKVWACVRRVPAGAVTTYGDVAAALGRRSVARQVGWALSALPDGSEVPWWRVVDGRGGVSRWGSAVARRQRALLQKEGVRVDARGRVVGFALLRWGGG